jgi:hypothetical protein
MGMGGCITVPEIGCDSAGAGFSIDGLSAGKPANVCVVGPPGHTGDWMASAGPQNYVPDAAAVSFHQFAQPDRLRPFGNAP